MAVANDKLRWSAGLLEATCSDQLRNELFSAVGYLADVAGFIAFDAYVHDEARRVFRFEDAPGPGNTDRGRHCR